MKAIVQYFSNIWNLAIGLVKLVISFVTHFFDFLQYAMEIDLLAIDIINVFPSWLQYFALVTLIVSLLFLILGRVGGKS